MTAAGRCRVNAAAVYERRERAGRPHEAVGVVGAVTLQQAMAFELAQIVAQLVETIGAA
jgi:hypothetical protein